MHTLKKRELPSNILRYVLLLLGGAVSVMPMIYMISTSLKPNGALYEFPPKFFPALDTITIENYVYGDKTARNGAWQKGPGKAFVDSIKEAFPDIPIIAEDLGYLTPEVRELLEYSGFPGMKILQFAFDAREKSDYIPFKYPKNCVVYTGTHDNDTILGWLRSAPPTSVRYAKSYLLCETAADETCVDFFVSAALSCAADWAMIPIQDWLRLGHEARINTPSTLGGNWVWRLRSGSCTKALVKEMKRKTELYERNSVIEP